MMRRYFLGFGAALLTLTVLGCDGGGASTEQVQKEAAPTYGEDASKEMMKTVTPGGTPAAPAAPAAPK